MPQLVINYTPAVGARVVAAFGKVRGLVDAQGVLRNATVAEIEKEVRDYLIGVTLEQEQKDAIRAAAAAVQPVVLT